jgi:hypothetical protein
MTRRPAPVPLALIALLAGCAAMQPAPSAPARQTPTKAAPAPAAGGGATSNGSAASNSGKPRILLSSASGAAGQVVTVTATLQTGGASIAGTQNDIGFDPQQIVVAPKANGKPDCSANPAIGKEGTAFSYQPSGCKSAIGSGCSGVRALVLSLGSVDAIASGSALYTCRVQIAPQARAGAQSLTVSRTGFSSPKGDAIDGGGLNGSITVKPK